MLNLINKAAIECFNTWEENCSTRGSYDLRVPMAHDLLIVLKRKMDNEAFDKFFSSPENDSLLHEALQSEFRRRIL